MNRLVYLQNVVTLSLGAERCIGCGMCTIVCPHGVFNIDQKKAKITNKGLCMECGACVKNYPVQAISVRSGGGCVSRVIKGILQGTEPTCDCCCQKE